MVSDMSSFLKISRKFLLSICKGSVIGIAVAIPGISAGTMAFITGLYSSLISFISSIVPSLLKKKWKFLWSSFISLFPVFISMALAFLLAARWMVLIIEKFPVPFYSLFSGIILMSVGYLFRQIKFHSINVILIIISAILSFSTSFFQEFFFEGNVWFFSSVYLSVLAMLLPGVSGSYILVLMGTYSRFLNSFYDLSLDSLIILFALTLSLISGAQFIQYLLKYKKEKMMSVLIGLTLGGGLGIFPLQVPFQENNLSSFVLFVLGVFLVGFSLKFVSFWDTFKKK